MIKGIIQKLLVAIDYRVQFLRDSEDYVEVWRIQYIFPAGAPPTFPLGTPGTYHPDSLLIQARRRK